MQRNTALIYSILLLALVVLFINGISSILLPFILGFVFSYFLAPIVSKLSKVGLPKSISSILVIIIFFGIIIFLSLTIVPIVYLQFVHLADGVLDHKAEIQKSISGLISWIYKLDPNIANKLEDIIANFSGTIFSFTSHMLKEVLYSGVAVISKIALIFVTPIVMFFCMKDWDNIIETIASSVPKKYRVDAYSLATDVNKSLSGYIKGQTYVCILLALFYASTLSFVQLDSAVALGVMSGLLVCIPYIGVVFSGILCTLVAIMQSGSIDYTLVVLMFFAIGQVLEGNLLSPYFIGKNVGLSPIWIIFGVLCGAALMGFVGVLIALPLTAVMGVVIRFSFRKYKKSKFYNSTSR